MLPFMGGVIAGVGGTQVSIGDLSISDAAVDPSTAFAGYSLESDGDIIANVVDVGDWIAPKNAAGSSYDVRATLVSGAVSSGTTGSWLSLGTTRTWTVTRSGAGVNTATLTIEIRDAASGTVLDSATITLTATVEV